MSTELKGTTALSPDVQAAMMTLLSTVAKGNPDAMKNLLADSLLTSSVDGLLAKAHDAMEGEGIRQVHDHWDGSPAGRVETYRVSGGGSGDNTSDKGPVGPGQHASGEGAAEMIRQYSELARRQAETTRVTTRLGEDLNKAMTAVKAILDAMQGMNKEFVAIKGIVAKAEEEKAKHEEEMKKKHDEEEAAKAVAAKAESDMKKEDEKEHEKEAESDEPKEKAAAVMRVHARQELSKAQAAFDAALAAPTAGVAGPLLAKADTHLTVAKAHADAARTLNPDSTIGLPMLQKSIIRLAKALPEGSKHNQEVWPDGSGEDKTAAKAAPAVDPNTNLANVVADINKALSGISLLQTTVAGLVSTVGGQSRNPSGLPPVFELAKAVPAALEQIETGIERLQQDGAINEGHADAGREVLSMVKAAGNGIVPSEIVTARINRLTEPVKALFANLGGQPVAA